MANRVNKVARERKVRLSLSLREDLVRRARALRINLSDLLESALEGALRRAEQDRWRAENRDAIAEYNETIRKDGVFSDGLRRF